MLRDMEKAGGAGSLVFGKTFPIVKNVYTILTVIVYALNVWNAFTYPEAAESRLSVYFFASGVCCGCHQCCPFVPEDEEEIRKPGLRSMTKAGGSGMRTYPLSW